MRKSFTWVTVLLAAVLLVGWMPTASAAPDALHAAIEAGREVQYSGGVKWNNPSLLDDETNSLLNSLLDSIKVSGRYGTDGEADYGVLDLLMRDTSVLSVSKVVTEDGVYVGSSFQEGTVAVPYTDVEAFFGNLAAYLQENLEYTVDGYPVDHETFVEMIEDRMSGLIMEENPLASLDMDALLDALDAWSETALEGEAYEGAIVSILGVETSNATLYQITKDELISLMDTILPILRENEAYWSAIYAYMAQLDTYEEYPPFEEIFPEIQASLDSMPEMMAAALSDDLVLRYNECYDADGNHVLGEIEAYMTTEYDENMIFYAEWLPEGNDLYLYAGVDSDGASFSLTTGDDSFTALCTVIEEDETIAQFVISGEGSETETADGREKTAVLLLEVIAGGEENGLEFVMNTRETYAGDDVAIAQTLDCYILYGTEEYPLLTVSADIRTVDPQGLPFSITEDEGFAYPGQMDEEAFAAWMNEDVTLGAMQTVMRMMGMLPQDVLNVLMRTEDAL